VVGAHTFYTFEGAVRLQEALRTFSGGRIAVVVGAMPYKCPGAPHEAAMLIRDYFVSRGLAAKVEVHFYTPEAQGSHSRKAMSSRLTLNIL
jgi:sulfide:quinone oxidoreductase